jgi:hypothetical protein
MPTEVTEAEKAMRKLSRESAPAKVLRAPYQLAQTRMAIERFEAAKNIKTESRVRSFFRRNRGADAPLDIQLKALKIREEALANDFIEGTLTPLTEAETWEVRCEWGAIRAMLLAKEDAYEGEGKAIYHAEVEKVSSGIWIQKWVGIALKKKDKVDGRWERYAAPGQFGEVEPVAWDLLFSIYHETFNLTDAELKKLQASTTQPS